MSKTTSYFQTSIGRKQTVAITGLLLILYLIAHLAGNLLIFAGPNVFNGYAGFLKSLRPGLYVIEVLLALIFLIHIFFTYMLVVDNVRARPKRYRINSQKSERSFATQIMPFTGTIILAFLFYHLWDFTFTPHDGAQSILPDGKNYGLYGLVYNAFSDPLHSTFYIIAMMCVGFHLSHGIESCCQTYGLANSKYMPTIRMFSQTFGVLVGWGFSMIPIYILVKNLSGS